MPLSEIRHQARAHRIVQQALSGDRMPHAYIFDGPEGVGKETFALALAKVLLCPNAGEAQASTFPELEDWDRPARDACGACDDCRAVDAETHPDLHRIYRQLNKFHPDTTVRSRKALDLGVDVIRHFVIDAVGAKPVRGRAKVFVVREADRITPAAQNALLKTLEEPPPTTFLFLLVSSRHRLLPTTLSRCQVVPFGSLPDSFVAEQLATLKPELSPADAAFVARLAEGSLGTAVQYADDGIVEYNNHVAGVLDDLESPGVLGAAKELVDQAKTLASRFRERDPEISDTEAQRQGLKIIFALLSAQFRHSLRRAVGADEPDGGGGTAVATAKKPDVKKAADAISAIRTAESQLDRNANVQLSVESLLLALARR